MINLLNRNYVYTARLAYVQFVANPCQYFFAVGCDFGKINNYIVLYFKGLYINKFFSKADVLKSGLGYRGRRVRSV